DNLMTNVFTSGFQNLTSLSITVTSRNAPYKITRNGLMRLGKLTNLKALELSGCIDACSARNIETLARQLPTLRELLLNNAPFMSYLFPDSILRIRGAVQSLRHLDCVMILGIKNRTELVLDLTRWLRREVQVEVF